MSGQVALNGEKRNAYKVLGRKSEENRSLKKPRHRREDNNKMDVKNRSGGHRPDLTVSEKGQGVAFGEQCSNMGLHKMQGIS
jgi:hypothetical protein